MKVSDLEGAQLDYWVGKADGQDVCLGDGHCWRGFQAVSLASCSYYEPSQNWFLAGLIVEREEIDLEHRGIGDARWSAASWGHIAFGPTPLIAAMRCFVASKFGDEVECVAKMQAAK